MKEKFSPVNCACAGFYLTLIIIVFVMTRSTWASPVYTPGADGFRAKVASLKNIVAVRNPSSSMLQFKAGGHILGFQPGKAYLAGLDHALAVEFLGTSGVTPAANGTAHTTDVATKVPLLKKVVYRNIWQGIHLTYEATKEGVTESTYHVAPGADVAKIRLRYNVPVEIMKDGSLKLTFDTGYLTESKPVAWQDIDGRRAPVAVAFDVSGQVIGFTVGQYNTRHPLIIDPTYAWHTFYGSSGYDIGNGIAVDGSGNVYVSGNSNATWGTPLHAHSGGDDIFVLKLSSSGDYQWHTFYGSSGSDQCADIAIDSDGNVYVTGYSKSSWGSPLHAHTANEDIFVLKLNGSGAYQWHTFYGSSVMDSASGIAISGNGGIYVTGISGDWGTPLHAFSGSKDIFVLKLNNNGELLWNTFYGSSNGEEIAFDIALDGNENIYVAGQSYFTFGSPLHGPSGACDAVILKLSSNGELLWNTFYAVSYTHLRRRRCCS